MGRKNPRELVLSPQTVAVDLRRNYAVRLHMFLIVSASVAMGTIVTAGMLAVGVDALWKRYLPALFVAYATFLGAVWLWLHMSRYGRHLRGTRSDVSGLDLVDSGGDALRVLEGIGPAPVQSVGGEVLHGAGGAFDGGGASVSWASDAAGAVGDSSGAGDALGGAADVLGGADEGIFLVIAIALVAIALIALFGATGYIVYEAPNILAEVVFEVLLASPFIKGARAVGPGNWSGALLRRTWKPFAIVCVTALAFAFFAASVAPQARTAADVIRVLVR
jgi:hypothetical protein